MTTNLLFALLLLLANGFFVAVEFALIASRRTTSRTASASVRSSLRNFSRAGVA